MDNAKRVSSNTHKKPSKSKQPPGLSHRSVHIFLGLVLMEAALCKLAESVFQSQDWSTTSLLLMLFYGLEFIGGVVLLFGLAPGLGHRCAVAAFTGFAISNSVHIAKGVCSCGCLGAGVAINPWAMLLFDLAVLIALLTCNRPLELGPDESLGPLRSPVLVAMAAVIVLVGWQQGAYVTLEGRAIRDGQPVRNREITFRGPSGRLVSRTDGNGHFHLPHVPAGTYVATISYSWVWVEVSSCTEGLTHLEFAPRNKALASTLTTFARNKRRGQWPMLAVN